MKNNKMTKKLTSVILIAGFIAGMLMPGTGNSAAAAQSLARPEIQKMYISQYALVNYIDYGQLHVICKGLESETDILEAQLRYSTSKSMKNAKVLDQKDGDISNWESFVVVLGKLKAGTTYYVQIRSYMQSEDGTSETIYSPWSNTHKITYSKKAEKC